MEVPTIDQSSSLIWAYTSAHVPRGMLEFRADPESPYHNPALRKETTVVLYCASGGRSALAGKTLQELQQAAMPVIGFLHSEAPGRYTSPILRAFRQGLSESGHHRGLRAGGLQSQ
jgi:hypothetical protein